MHQFFTNQPLIKSARVKLDKPQEFQIFKVLKLKPNELIRLVNQEEIGYLARITDDVEFELLDPISFPKKQRTVILGLSLIRSEKLELAIQKATEIGVEEIILIQAQRSIAKLNLDKIENKLLRYQAIAKEAAEQSHQAKIPTIERIYKSTDLPQDLSQQIYFGCLQADPYHFSTVSLMDSATLLIGPEGGWSESEEIYFKEKHFIPFRFSNTVLRSETAAIIGSYILVNHEN